MKSALQQAVLLGGVGGHWLADLTVLMGVPELVLKGALTGMFMVQSVVIPPVQCRSDAAIEASLASAESAKAQVGSLPGETSELKSISRQDYIGLLAGVAALNAQQSIVERVSKSDCDRFSSEFESLLTAPK